MKMNYLTVAVAVFFLTMTACSGSSQKKNENVIETPVEEVQETIFGTYEGTLPAADCYGIRTVLTVNSDSTYSLMTEYIGEDQGAFETSGVYNMIGNELIELVTPSSGDKTYYKIVADGVMLSDSLGTENQGELAKHYVLKKK